MGLATDEIDLTGMPATTDYSLSHASKASGGHGRKRKAAVMEKSVNVIDLTGDHEEVNFGAVAKGTRGKIGKKSMPQEKMVQSPTKEKTAAAPSKEKRLRRWVLVKGVVEPQQRLMIMQISQSATIDLS
jgi:hypothetical protein